MTAPVKETFMEETEHVERRAHRKLFRFDPTVSSGTLLQLATLLIGFAVAYGTYRSDQTQIRADILAGERTVEANRIVVQNSLTEIKQDLKATQVTANQTATDVAVIRAQLSTQRRAP